MRHTCFVILPTDGAAGIFANVSGFDGCVRRGVSEPQSTALGRLAKLVGDKVYIIHPTPSERSRISNALKSEPVTIETYDSAEQFLNRVAVMSSGCILVPSCLSGMGVRALIGEILGRDVALPIVVIGRDSDLATAVELVRAGATDFLEESFSDRQLRSAVRRAFGFS
jgi:FixJ family two-component response regulator